jgi:hypothetical protein
MPESNPMQGEVIVRGRMVPDPKTCSTTPIAGVVEFAKCLVERPIACPYLVYIRKHRFCHYRNWETFIKPSLRTNIFKDENNIVR